MCGCCIRAGLALGLGLMLGLVIGLGRVKLINYSLIIVSPIATSAHPLFTRGPNLRKLINSRLRVKKGNKQYLSKIQFSVCTKNTSLRRDLDCNPFAHTSP